MSCLGGTTLLSLYIAINIQLARRSGSGLRWQEEYERLHTFQHRREVQFEHLLSSGFLLPFETLSFGQTRAVRPYAYQSVTQSSHRWIVDQAIRTWPLPPGLNSSCSIEYLSCEREIRLRASPGPIAIASLPTTESLIQRRVTIYFVYYGYAVHFGHHRYDKIFHPSIYLNVYILQFCQELNFLIISWSLAPDSLIEQHEFLCAQHHAMVLNKSRLHRWGRHLFQTAQHHHVNCISL